MPLPTKPPATWEFPKIEPLGEGFRAAIFTGFAPDGWPVGTMETFRTKAEAWVFVAGSPRISSADIERYGALMGKQ